MPNPQLSPDQLKVANGVLSDLRTRIEEICGDDEAHLFALRRKIAKELTYDERGKPMERKALKLRKREAQGGLCPVCGDGLPETHAVLDRVEAIGGYTDGNTRLICPECDASVQKERGYR